MTKAPYPTRFPKPGKPPRAAAAVLLLREGPPANIFTVRRSPKLRFLGGFGGYPGGRVDTLDAQMAGVEDRFAEPAMAIAAARELFEEAGVLVCPGAESIDDETLDRERRALLDGETDFGALCHRLSIDPIPAPGTLLPAGRWVTPYYSPLRYDTAYYVHVHRGTREPVVWPGELSEGAWTRPQDVLQDWRDARCWLAPPVTETLRVLADGIDPVAPLLERLRDLSVDRGHPYHPVRMRYGIRLLSLLSRTLPPSNFTNSYFVGEQELLLFDPGASPGEPRDQLMAVIERLLAQGRRIRWTVLSHHHLDHVDSAIAVRQRFGIPIAAHPRTAQALRDARRAAYRPELHAIDVDREVEDGFCFELAGGFNVRVLLTPGHTRGHICLLEERGGSLLAGDLVSGLSPVIIDPPEGNMAHYFASLQAMIDHGDYGLFPGHGPPATSSRARLTLLLKHRRWRQQRLVEVLQGAQQPMFFEELVEEVYADVPGMLHPFAARSLHAHLEKLQEQGVIVATNDGQCYRMVGAQPEE